MSDQEVQEAAPLPGQPQRGKKAFGKNVIWNTFSFISGYALALILSIILARTLGPERVGLVNYITWLTDTAMMLAGLGFLRAIERYMAQELGAGNTQHVGMVAKRSLRSIFLMTLVTASVACALLYQYFTKHGGFHWAYFPIVFLLVVFGGLWGGAQAGSRGLYNFKVISSSTIFRGGATVIIWAAMLHYGAPIWSLFAVGALLTAICFYYVYHASGLSGWVRQAKESDEGLWGSIKSYSRQVTMIVVADTIVLQRTELQFLAIFATQTAIGYYNYAASLTMLVARIPLSFSQVLFPVFARKIGEGAEDQAKDLYSYSSKWVLALTLPIGGGMWVMADPLISTIFGPEFRPSVEPLRILVIAAMMVPLGSPAASYLHSTGRQDFLMKLAPFSLGFNLLLDLVLISRWGLMGAAWASAVSRIVFIAILLNYVRYNLGLKLPWFDILRCCIAAAVYAYICLWVEPYGKLGLLIAFAGVSVYVILLVALGTFKDEIGWIRKKKHA